MWPPDRGATTIAGLENTDAGHAGAGTHASDGDCVRDSEDARRRRCRFTVTMGWPALGDGDRDDDDDEDDEDDGSDDGWGRVAMTGPTVAADALPTVGGGDADWGARVW